MDWNAKIEMPGGSDIPDQMETRKDGEGLPPLTLRAAVYHALFMTFPDEQNLSGEKKFERARLAMRVYEEANPVLSSEEITLAKQLVGKLYSPLIVLRVWQALDVALRPRIVEEGK